MYGGILNDGHRIVLYPSWTGHDLLVLLLGHADDRTFVIEHDESCTTGLDGRTHVYILPRCSLINCSAIHD